MDGECVNEIGSYHCACDEYHMIHPVNPHFCIMGISNNADENLTEERNWFKSLAWSYNDPVCGDQVSFLESRSWKVEILTIFNNTVRHTNLFRNTC